MRINIPMTDDVERYLDRYAYREHPTLAACRAEAARRGKFAVMQIAPEQGAFLQILIRITGARRILELGTFTGYSTLAMALALPSDGRIVTCDNEAEIVDVARAFWADAGVANRIDVRIGDALQTMDSLSADDGAPFDIAFIDADKPPYPAYYEKALGLVRVGGLVLVDDTLARGRVVTGALPDDGPHMAPAVDGIRALNEQVRADARVDMVLLPWRDGLTIARKK